MAQRGAQRQTSDGWDDEDDWDDAGFDIVEAPPVVHSVTVNSSGTRFAVAHSRGCDVFALFSTTSTPPSTLNASSTHAAPSAAPRPTSSGTADAHLPLLQPQRLLGLDHRHLNPGVMQMHDSFEEIDSIDHAERDADPRHGSSSSRPNRRKGGGEGKAAAAPASVPSAGVGLVALLYETNVLAVVGGGDTPCQPPNLVLLFNGEYEQQRIRLLGPVARVVLQNRRVIALSQSTITIHSFSGEKLLEESALGWVGFSPPGAPSVARLSSAAISSILHKASGVPSGAAGKASPSPHVNQGLPPAPTGSSSSPGGSFAGATPRLRRMPLDVANVERNALVAYPDPVVGTVALCDWLNATRLSVRIAAHRSDVDALALCSNAEALVTASDTNTVLRVWNTTTGAQLREVRLSSHPHTTYLRAVGLYTHHGESPSPQPSAFTPDYAMSLDSKGEMKFFFVGSADSDPSSNQFGPDGVGGGHHDHLPHLHPQARNQGSLLSKFQFVSSYFASEWHASSVTLPFLPPPHLSPPPPLVTAGAEGSHSVAPSAASAVRSIEAIAWFEQPAALVKYRTTTQSAAAGVRRGPSDVMVSVACLTGSGVVARVGFTPATGKVELLSRSNFATAS
jgi:hypothetical protein